MSILTRQFHYHEDGSHFEKWHYLARDTDSGKMFVLRETNGPRGESSSSQIEIEKFLSGESSTATSKLRALIGTLVTENSDA